jgi:hypothetical protein
MPATSASLYEKLFPLTTVMKQRMVENFSGDALNTDRWGTQTSTGASYVMNNEVDGGLKVTTGTGLYNPAGIGFAPTSTSGNPFNTPRQYSHTGSVIIFVQKWTSHTAGTSASTSGFHSERRGDNAGANGCAGLASLWNANFLLRTCAGNQSQSNTNTTVPVDNNWHSYKIELTSSSAGESIDGALEVSHTTNLPADKMAPCFGVQNHSNNGASSFNLSYVEAYNT